LCQDLCVTKLVLLVDNLTIAAGGIISVWSYVLSELLPRGKSISTASKVNKIILLYSLSMANLSQLNSRMDLGHAVVFAKNLLTPFWVPRRLSLFKAFLGETLVGFSTTSPKHVGSKEKGVGGWGKAGKAGEKRITVAPLGTRRNKFNISGA